MLIRGKKSLQKCPCSKLSQTNPRFWRHIKWYISLCSASQRKLEEWTWLIRFILQNSTIYIWAILRMLSMSQGSVIWGSCGTKWYKQTKVTADQGDFKGSNRGPDNRDNKGYENKSSKTKIMLVWSNMSEIILQSWALNRGVFKTAWLQSYR